MKRLEIQRRHLQIVENGCIACRKRGFHVPPEEHHLNEFGWAGHARRGPEFTIGLCPWHHRGEPLFPSASPSVARTRALLGPSLAKEPIRFRQVFGDDDDLLRQTNEVISANKCGVA